MVHTISGVVPNAEGINCVLLLNRTVTGPFWRPVPAFMTKAGKNEKQKEQVQTCSRNRF
jgi:hypothetical protein